MTATANRPGRRLAAPAKLAPLAACVAGLLLLLAATAAAAAPPQLWQTGETGSAAGQTEIPRGIAADPGSGHVFLADSGNERIDEFAAAGEFLRAWGWGVVASGPDNNPRNEIQQVSVDATGGDFKLSLSIFSNTPSIPFNASAATVQTALEGLTHNPGEPGLDPGDVTVSGPAGGPWSIEFTGAQADTDFPQFHVASSTLSGGPATATVLTTQPGANFEVCIPDDGDQCRAGQAGSSPGQFGFGSPQGVALDSAGDVYVVDTGRPSNQRVQKFSPSGQFLLMFGKGVNSGSSGNPEICTNAGPPTDVCGPGGTGAGAGQFGEWPAVGDYIAIAGHGTETTADDDVYVGDQNRIQRFDANGAYQSQFPVPATVQGLDTDAAGDLYAIYGGVIHKLSPLGSPLSPETFEIPKLNPSENPQTAAVAVDVAGHIYAFGPTTSPFTGQTRNPVFEFDPTGNVVNEFGKAEFTSSTGLATNLCPGSAAPGDIYVANAANPEVDHEKSFLRAYGTDPIGCFKAHTLGATEVAETSATLNGTVNPSGVLSAECRFQYGTSTQYANTAPCAESPAQIGAGGEPVPVHAAIAGLAAGTVYHFRLRAQIKGQTETGPDLTFKTIGPPVISDDHTVAATDTEASLKASINPEGLPTAFRVQYTTTDFLNCGLPANPSCLVGPQAAVGSDRNPHPASAALHNLLPGTSYRWRILATNSSGTTESEAHTLNTYRPLLTETDCPNQALRSGASAFLPDCRAFELVSPPDKNGGDLYPEPSGELEVANYTQVSTDGNAITYTARTSFGDQHSTANFNQYLASRRERGQSGEGWSNQGINPPVAGQEVDEAIDTFGYFRKFIAFSPDLCSAWLIDHQTPPPTADGQPGRPNLYRRENCGAGGLEALIPSPAVAIPPGTQTAYVTRNSVEGYSADGRHALFVANAQLTPEAAAGFGAQVYDRFEGALHLVSVLPGGSAAPGHNEVGAGANSNLDHAVSADGSLVYWTSNGDIYLRRHPEQGIVANECKNPARACTLPVSAGAGAFFWTAAADGSRALYSEAAPNQTEDLYEFDLAKAEAKEPPRRLIAHSLVGLAGASADLSRIYFVSTDALAGAGPNSEGEEAQPGQPNLYLDQEGARSFIATLASGDAGALEPEASVVAYGVAENSPYSRGSRVSANGTIVFDARAPLTGYDNSTGDGRRSVEVFRYRPGGPLQCISCNPSGARPSQVREMREPYHPLWAVSHPTHVLAAAWIPTWEHPLHASNVLSADGSRVFFNSNDALLPRDTNGTQDVYEWEAPGAGGCDLEDPSYFAQNGGCLYLISSGESSYESEFLEASSDGRDVFFTTESGLLPQDPGSVDLYDARIEGGFPQPIEPPACEGEACQGPVVPPNDPTPSSSVFRGPGNQLKGSKARCPKGKRQVRRAGKARCLARGQKKQSKGHKRRANDKRRAKR